MAILRGPSRGQLVNIRKSMMVSVNSLGTRKRLCLAKRNDHPETRDVPSPQSQEVHLKSLVDIPDSLEYHTIHHSEDTVHEGLCKGKKSKFLAQWIPEIQGTFNDFPSGRFLEKLALSDDRFGRWPFKDAYFDHYGWKDHSLRKLAFLSLPPYQQFKIYYHAGLFFHCG